MEALVRSFNRFQTHGYCTWLQVGIGQGRLCLPFHGKLGQVRDDLCQLGQNNVHGLTHENEFRVVGDIAARRLRDNYKSMNALLSDASASQETHSVVNNTSRGWRDGAKGVNVSHDIVSAPLLLDPGNLEVFVCNFKMLPHLFKGLKSDRVDTKLPLRLGQKQPELAPLRMTRALAEELRHLLAAVPGGQRRLVRVEGRRPGVVPLFGHFWLQSSKLGDFESIKEQI